LRGGLLYAAVRTILAGCANDTSFALQRPMVRRRADNVFLASHASWRLFYKPYIGGCQATAAESITDLCKYIGKIEVDAMLTVWRGSARIAPAVESKLE